MQETTASNLKKLRDYFNLSMSAISKSVGVSRNSWSRYEKEICKPRIETARKILDWLDEKLPTPQIKMVFGKEIGWHETYGYGFLKYIYKKEEK